MTRCRKQSKKSGGIGRKRRTKWTSVVGKGGRRIIDHKTTRAGTLVLVAVKACNEDVA